MKFIRRKIKKIIIKSKILLNQSLKVRLLIAMLCISCAFCFISARLFFVTSGDNALMNNVSIAQIYGFNPKRKNIYDRNGNLLATNIPVSSVFVDPSKVSNPAELADKLLNIFPGLQQQKLENALQSNKKFFWIKRHLTPQQTQEIIDLGEPSLNFKHEEMRSYPYGNLFAHLVGTVDVDNIGTTGVEKYFNHKLEKDDIRLSADVKLQSIIREELINAIQKNEAIGGCGAMVNVNTGEVLAMVSLPDFEPQSKKIIEEERFNRATMGLYEPGSTMKTFTVAIALNEKVVELNDIFDISKPIKIGRHRINDFRKKYEKLSLPEVLMQSSNIGMAQIIEKLGIDKQRKYLENLGFFDKISTLQLPELAQPTKPNAENWGKTSSITISYGHGIAVTPMHVLQGYTPLVNGGYHRDFTLLHDPDNNTSINEYKIFSDEVSEVSKKLLHLVVKSGFGKNAQVKGYDLGGKTGTSEKPKDGKYSNDNIASFIGVFPIDAPQYALYIMIDEPKRNKHNRGFTTGGMVAAPIASSIIKRIMPILDIIPKNNFALEEQLYAFYEPYKTIGK